jgi:hypothetical protein
MHEDQMNDNYVGVHPITINVRSYPPWERFRVAIECLLFGEVSFKGEVTEVKSATDPGYFAAS